MDITGTRDLVQSQCASIKWEFILLNQKHYFWQRLPPTYIKRGSDILQRSSLIREAMGILSNVQQNNLETIIFCPLAFPTKKKISSAEPSYATTASTTGRWKNCRCRWENVKIWQSGSMYGLVLHQSCHLTNTLSSWWALC